MTLASKRGRVRDPPPFSDYLQLPYAQLFAAVADTTKQTLVLGLFNTFSMANKGEHLLVMSPTLPP